MYELSRMKKNELLLRLYSIGVRLFSLLSRFALLLFLANHLDATQVGVYGLFTATIGYGVLLIGGDFYSYSQRELISAENNDRSFVIKHQVTAYLILYALCLPFQFIIFYFEFLPDKLVYWFIFLLVLEHISQEINRILIAFQRQGSASTVLFFRMSAWILFLIPVMWFAPGYRKLEVLLFFWSIGSLFAIFLGTWLIWSYLKPWQNWPLNWKWILRGFKVSALYFLGTLCLRGLFTFDRYAVEALIGPDFLGAYVIYIGMAMAIISFVDAGVMFFMYPRLVDAYKKRNKEVFIRIIIELCVSALFLSIFLALVVAFCAPIILSWIADPIYTENLHVLWLLLLMTVVYVFATVVHYGLYAKGHDGSILFSHLASFLIFCISLLVFRSIVPIEAVAISLIAAVTCLACLKTFYLIRFPFSH